MLTFILHKLSLRCMIQTCVRFLSRTRTTSTSVKLDAWLSCDLHMRALLRSLLRNIIIWCWRRLYSVSHKWSAAMSTQDVRTIHFRTDFITGSWSKNKLAIHLKAWLLTRIIPRNGVMVQRTTLSQYPPSDLNVDPWGIRPSSVPIPWLRIPLTKDLDFKEF